MEQFDLEIDEKSKANLLLAAKHAKNLTISVFVLLAIALLAIIGFSFFGNVFGKSALSSLFEIGGYSVFLLFFFLIVCIIAILFFNLLLSFSKKTSSGLNNNDIVELTSGFNSLKIYFIISGVVMILGFIGDIFSLFN